MNVLMVAFDCDPFKESESLVSFNTALAVSSTNNVTVITRPKCRNDIEKWQTINNYPSLKFVYIDCPIFKKETDVLKGFIRTFVFSFYVNKWMRKLISKIKELDRINHFDVIHRVTPNSYRLIPNLSYFKNCVKVLGPVGGVQETPKAFRRTIKGKNRFEDVMHRIVNWKTLHSSIFKKKLNSFDTILCCNQETLIALKKVAPTKKLVLMSDCGLNSATISLPTKRELNSPFRFLFVGRIMFRKGLDFLFDCLYSIKDLNFVLTIVGGGPELEKLKKKAILYGLSSKISFVGRVSLDETNNYYKNSDAFVFPSLRESSGSVVFEAAGHGLPIVSLDIGGGHTMITPELGTLVPVDKTYRQIVTNYSSILKEMINHNGMSSYSLDKAQGALAKSTWESKTQKLNKLYQEEDRKYESKKF